MPCHYTLFFSLDNFHHVKHSSQIHLQYKMTAARCLVMRSEQLFFEIRNTWLRGHFVEFLLPETCKALPHTHHCCPMWKIHIDWPLQLKQWQEVVWIHQIRADICHEYHELYSWIKNCHVEKFQLSMYDNCGEIENFSTYGEISVQLMGFYCNLCRFVAKSVIHAVLSRNFCHNLRAFMWRKIEPRSTFI